MTDYCVMVFRPRRTDVHIVGPFLNLEFANQWMTDNARAFPDARFEIRVLQRRNDHGCTYHQG